MTNTKKSRENLSALILRAKGRFMTLTAEAETGVEIFGTEDQLLGVAFPNSELSMKWAKLILELVSKDAELCQLENILADRERDKTGIVRPRVPLS